MYNPIRIHKVSFKYAIEGIFHNIKTQPNFRFHLFAIICVCFAGYFLSVSYLEWLVLIFTFNMVLVSEMVNTSIEAMVDLITLEKHKNAKIAKDVSAGMVLVSAIFSIIIGLYIFLPKILQLI